MARLFSVGDKVFAKVRGYPAWPARVEKITEVSSNKSKYHVFFYGTSETAVCKVEDLYNYENNKEKYGKPLKRKGFNEALAQIEGIISVPVVCKQEVKIKEEPDDSDVEGNLVIDENPKHIEGKKKAVKRKRESGSEYIDSKPSASGGNGVSSYKRVPIPPQKRFKKVGSSMKDTSNVPGHFGSSDSKFINGSPVSSTKPEIISRSGRKIKPKKFADEEAFEPSTLCIDSEVAPKVVVENVTNKRRILSGHSSGYLTESTKKRNRINMRNASAVSNPVPGCSSMSSRRYNVVDGSFVLPSDEKDASNIDRLMWFRNEARMLEIETMIRGHLCIKKANTSQGIDLLKQLCDLDIQPLMLKKHPQIVKTIKKIRRYVGNPDAWNLSEEQMRTFSDDATQIRTIGDTLYTKFRGMFTVPEDHSFWQVFLDEVAAFKKKTESLPVIKLCALTMDPTISVHSENVQSKSQPAVTEPKLISQIKTEPVDVDSGPESHGDLKSPLPTGEYSIAMGTMKTLTQKNENQQISLTSVKHEVVSYDSSEQEEENAD